MAKFVGNWRPETPAEEAFILEINEIAREAYEAGVEPTEIVAAFAFLQGAYLEESPDADVQSPDADVHPESESPADASTTEPSASPTCPECGGEVADVLMQMGGGGEISPCGCRVTHHALQKMGWFDDE